ncbi:phosphopyruvate hydratase [Candidatus Woesebacteria bacterium RIFCSPLOWO2_01_FULL_39_23]|uniref:Enolase n=1 Tax=Candidatus Woesebacteria bacterium RIFCSPHIGHO2_01_FULL_40_22 TaxID=1802499 RepID=A0A1F7YKN8_9BACT|nr:MAG: phosphopyruvate hydratase [Candidatus Woesebacteria bacterium RBG_16_40_11]OGM27449.1 MAG: phosphopyruvate hydratase [Candidatus Woesebacteria bacterium RIFCSPHIGHO2_01_FULL_40_22]OGM36439.1 MAG: phosphopyruvate hydratase [Candidatus Woesebacteria bacterium RIFCSPHIGHO2_12_FULL_38_9]OGM62623.1 MAG: phosphopyruvate hydratase [Candidatus Woesebacteria bacterium RIFCSPLOWO2_01_FULL_39_23]
MDSKIRSIKAREILSSNGLPTLETTVLCANGTNSSVSIPYGESAGKYEAVTIFDEDKSRYEGYGMLKAVKIVDEIISPQLAGVDVTDQKQIDQKLFDLDPTPQKTNLGGNSLLSVSLACAKTASVIEKLPLYIYIQKTYGFDGGITNMPKPNMVVLEGGKHADNSTDFQEYSVSVIGKFNCSDSVRAGIEIYRSLGRELKLNGFNINVGAEGAYAAVSMKSNIDPLLYIKNAIEKTKYIPEKDVGISLDPAASEFYESGFYNLSKDQKKFNSSEMITYYENLLDNYPIISIEDGLAEEDWDNWKPLFTKLSEKIMIVGDDLTVTQEKRLKRAIDEKTINSIIIKPNQAGTLTETMATVMLAKDNNIKTIVSHRGGGETTDTFIIDLAVAIGAEYVKVGPTRGERTQKYNRLMEIAAELNL